MKKFLILNVFLLLIICGCGKSEENLLKVDWQLDNSIRPSFNFERSKKNNYKGIFYVDSQITFNDFVTYAKKLKDNGYEIVWQYSDAKTLDEIEKQYSNQSSKDNIFKDGYINYKVCKSDDCLMMQWVDKEKYNSTNKEKPVSYSFKLEVMSKEK